MKRGLEGYVTDAKRSKLDVVFKAIITIYSQVEKDGYVNLVKEFYQKRLNELFEVEFLRKEASTEIIEDDYVRDLASLKAAFQRN